VLALVGDWAAGSPISAWSAVLIGLVSTPLAPIAKDLSSSIAAAANAVAAVKR
jgi:hypothetical protein